MPSAIPGNVLSADGITADSERLRWAAVETTVRSICYTSCRDPLHTAVLGRNCGANMLCQSLKLVVQNRSCFCRPQKNSVEERERRVKPR